MSFTSFSRLLRFVFKVVILISRTSISSLFWFIVVLRESISLPKLVISLSLLSTWTCIKLSIVSISSFVYSIGTELLIWKLSNASSKGS